MSNHVDDANKMMLASENSEKKYLVTMEEAYLLESVRWGYEEFDGAIGAYKWLTEHEYHERTCKQLEHDGLNATLCSSCHAVLEPYFVNYCPYCGGKVEL